MLLKRVFLLIVSLVTDCYKALTTETPSLKVECKVKKKKTSPYKGKFLFHEIKPL